jgi:hypothetical protein
MLNLKKNLYIAIALALCALYACSSDNPSSAGSTTIPNATADNDSIVFEGDKPIIPELIELRGDQDTAFYSKLTAFETEPTSLSSDMDSLDVKLYDKENGAAATCTAGDQSFNAKFKMESRYGYIFKTLTMHNVGAACDSILQEFQDVCNTNPKIIVDGGYSGFCTSTGDLYAFCADLSHLTLECSEPEADGTKKCHVKRDSTTALDTSSFIQDFVKKSESVCTDIAAGKFDVSDFDPIEDYWTPGHNPIDHLDTSNKGEPIDTAAFTLEKYAEQFADVSEGISFDSLVLAYRILPTSEIVLDTGSYTIREPSPAEVAKYFPMTTAITGENFNSEHCDIYTVAISGSQFLAIILTHIEYEYVKYALIFADGDCKKGDDFAQIFLIKDCTGEFDEYAVTSADGDIFENTPWTCDENGVPPGRENGPYGEWYRADLRQ